MKVINILFFIFCMSCISCKNSSASNDNLLTEASAIQEEALIIAGELTKLIQDKMLIDTSAAFREQGNTILQNIAEWKHNMVLIPGAAHNHDHHDHDHDHDHNHDHSHQEAASHLTPEEILNVQKEWKNYIIALKESVK